MLSRTVLTRSSHGFSLQAIKSGIAFYWSGTKQLGRNFANASTLIRHRAIGHHLSWEDQRRLAVCKSDLLRVVPFSIFIIVPFLEFLLPFFLYYFPSLLPSTYETAAQRKSRFEAIRANQLVIAEKLCHLTPNLKATMSCTPTPRFPFEEPLMDCLASQHAYLLTKAARKQAVFGKYTSLSLLRTTIRRYVRWLHEQDIALRNYGVVNMAHVDIEEACICRCMNPSRDDLEDWVNKSAADASLQTTTKLFFLAAMNSRLSESKA
ncbi:gamma-tubulin complex component 3-like protein [Perkinsela sp. CCAP 1560/4]|nr:gamma-tubulin complex component 3-like protein [Perkinsela sp. CCAP 1560/4]|eukprot:KNH07129.1 gamma-tubulin complex component 3-like protein [Perkinsela sp. CCAP 1560/4]